MVLAEPYKVSIIAGFMAVSAFLVMLHVPTIHYTESPWPEDLHPAVLYSTEIPDNYSQAVYKYNNLGKAAKSLNITDYELFLKLRSSQTFPLNCTAFDDPYHLTSHAQTFTAFACYIGNSSYFFFYKPYTSFGSLPDFLKANCTKFITQYECRFGTIHLNL